MNIPLKHTQRVVENTNVNMEGDEHIHYHHCWWVMVDDKILKFCAYEELLDDDMTWDLVYTLRDILKMPELHGYTENVKAFIVITSIIFESSFIVSIEGSSTNGYVCTIDDNGNITRFVINTSAEFQRDGLLSIEPLQELWHPLDSTFGEYWVSDDLHLNIRDDMYLDE